jgi:hypothetical protein
MNNSHLSEIHTVADVHGYDEDNGAAQCRDAVSFITDDVPALWARILPALTAGNIGAIVMDDDNDHLLIGREHRILPVRLLLALLTWRRPRNVYRYTEDLPVLDTDEKYHSLTRNLPLADADDQAAVTARTAELEHLWAYAAASTEIIIYDKVWGRTTQLRPTLRELNLI